MGAFTIAASVAGFMAAKFAISLWSEQFAGFYTDFYSESFYVTVDAPTVTDVSGAVISEEDRQVVARQCGFAKGDPMALSSTIADGAVSAQ